jgi:rhodanese-related sulfurtransferase
MVVTAIVLGILVLVIAYWRKQTRDRRELEQHSITPEALRGLLDSNQEVLIFDVRQPLDLLADSKIIPGAIRIPPKEVRENPSLIPRDKDTIVYCTCPSDKTSRAILHRALGLRFSRMKFLRGGLGAWQAKGYPVEPYRESFRLDTAS